MEFALRSCWCLDLGSGPQEGQVQAPGSRGREWEDAAQCPADPAARPVGRP